jgi:hypothetical protein
MSVFDSPKHTSYTKSLLHLKDHCIHYLREQLSGKSPSEMHYVATGEEGNILTIDYDGNFHSSDCLILVDSPEYHKALDEFKPFYPVLFLIGLRTREPSILGKREREVTPVRTISEMRQAIQLQKEKDEATRMRFQEAMTTAFLENIREKYQKMNIRENLKTFILKKIEDVGQKGYVMDFEVTDINPDEHKNSSENNSIFPFSFSSTIPPITASSNPFLFASFSSAACSGSSPEVLSESKKPRTKRK